ncbi:DMT family transporter [Rhodohalobacter halophilus]|uniref:DMT family transporter n=1 Tax=Rhodohalobacter halophilus TaxID=1812810 RepID=UPI00083F5394|nr:DMT family transporter [Rhodohalobacter halophilus]
MITGWIYIILSAAASVLIAHFLKVVENRNLSTVRVLTINYLVATAIAFSSSGFTGAVQLQTGEGFVAIMMAVVVGVIFIANFFIYSKSVYHNGVGISVAAMRISLIIPVLLSTLWYLEVLSTVQWAGVILVFITLFLLLPNKRKMLREPFSVAWLLVLLFIGTGLGDGSLKIYEQEFSTLLNKEQFMGFVFLSAFLIGLVIMTARRSWGGKKMEWVMGIAVGIPNLYTAIFLIEALERMNGAIVYSSVNVLTVLGGTLLGIIKWGDKLTRIQWVGIILTVITILLLI